MTSLKILKKLMTVGGLVSSMESEDSSHQIMWRSSFELPGMDHCNDMLAEVSWFFVFFSNTIFNVSCMCAF